MSVALVMSVDRTSVMLARLNLETQAYHAPADEGWRGLLARPVSRQRYVDQLVCAHGFDGPLEAALAYTPNLGLVIDVRDRYRAGYIAQDLLRLGLRPSTVARLPQLTIGPFASPLEALGWMYVAERATPLHEEVRRHIALHLPEAAAACAYLSANAGRVSARWQGLGRVLDDAARTEPMCDEIVSAAQTAFRAWIGWCRRDVTGTQRAKV